MERAVGRRVLRVAGRSFGNSGVAWQFTIAWHDIRARHLARPNVCLLRSHPNEGQALPAKPVAPYKSRLHPLLQPHLFVPPHGLSLLPTFAIRCVSCLEVDHDFYLTNEINGTHQSITKMRAQTVLAVLAAAVAASGQSSTTTSSSAQSTSGLTPCITNCSSSAATSAGCSS